MRTPRPTMVSLVLLTAAQIASADPSKAKLWVQIPTSSPSSLPMFREMVEEDHRVNPIIRIPVPWGVQFGTCGYNTTDPVAAGCDVAKMAEALTDGRHVDPATSMYNIGIQIAGFGSGGLGADVNNFYYPAPALATPRKPDDPIVNHDAIAGNYRWWETPWFNEGPVACAEWMRQFATAYSDEGHD